jgi:hypothetical protein
MKWLVETVSKNTSNSKWVCLVRIRLRRVLSYVIHLIIIE